MDLSLGAETNPRFQKIDKLALLALCPLFSRLSQWELKSISQLMRLVEYKKDEVIYQEGGEAGSFYVIVSGRFEASVPAGEKKKVLAYLKRGDYFGEMSLLTNEPHSATLRALSDSITLELKKDDFKKTVEHNAIISLELSRRLSVRLRGSDERSRSLLKSDVLSVFSGQSQIGRTAFSINLAASLFRETHQKTILLDMSPSGLVISSRLQMIQKAPVTQLQNIENVSSETLSQFIVKNPVGFDVLNVAHNPNDSLGEYIVIPLLNHLAIDYRFLIVDLPAAMDGTVTKALAQSDQLFVVTDSHMTNIAEAKDIISRIEKDQAFPQHKISVVINETLLGLRTTLATRKELFGQKICHALPATPSLRERDSTPFVTEEPEAEYSRVVRHIARRVSNNLVGLTLGSGAALGLAHIGVLKVLESEGVPVDIVGGSSIGALIGSLFALGKSAGEIEAAAMEISSRARLAQLMDISLLPVRGLLHGNMVIKHFKTQMGNKTFDDCRIPLKIMGANLSSRQLVTFESGFISDAVRSSISIPAIFKPTILNGEIVVDGGIMSPLPIGALQQAGANKVIAVNVFPTPKDVLERRLLMEDATQKEAVRIRQKNILAKGAYRMRRWVARRFFPNVFDILMNTIQTMETQIAEIESEAADLVIRPVMPLASWVDFYKPGLFIRRGEEETVKMLPKIKALVSQQNL